MFEDPKDNDPIRKYQQDQRELCDRAESLRPVVNSCNDAIARAESKALVTIATEVTSPRIRIIEIAKSLSDVVPLIRELAKEGIRDHDKQYKDNDLFGVMAMREYKLGPFVTLTVMLTGSTCKMKQVGTKEVPVYEMQCGGDTDAAINSPTGFIGHTV